jgi:hypothetical protein
VGTLLAYLGANPAVLQGFVGGVLGAIVVEVVHWRWRLVRRQHDD